MGLKWNFGLRNTLKFFRTPDKAQKSDSAPQTQVLLRKEVAGWLNKIMLSTTSKMRPEIDSASTKIRPRTIIFADDINPSFYFSAGGSVLAITELFRSVPGLFSRPVVLTHRCIA